MFPEHAKAEADILQKCFHKPREVLHCEMHPGSALDSGNSPRANSLAREKEQRNVKRLHLVLFEFDFHNFRASSVVEFNPVAHVRGQQRLAERRNPTDGVSFEIEFVDADNS